MARCVIRGVAKSLVAIGLGADNRRCRREMAMARLTLSRHQPHSAFQSISINVNVLAASGSRSAVMPDARRPAAKRSRRLRERCGRGLGFRNHVVAVEPLAELGVSFDLGVPHAKIGIGAIVA